MQQPVRVMDALGITRDFRANHACGVEVVFRAADATDRAAVQHLDFERAGRWAVVRTGGGVDLSAQRLVHRNRPSSIPLIIYQPSAVRRDLTSRYPTPTTKS